MNGQELLCLPLNNILTKLKTSQTGLTSEEVKKRLEIYGSNEVAKKRKEQL